AFTINAPAAPATPIISPSSPFAPISGSVNAGSGSFTLGVTGTGFVAGSVVLWNNGTASQTLATQFLGTTQLSALVPASLVSSARTVFISVQNPGGVTSPSVQYQVAAAPLPNAPTVSGIDPTQVTAGTGAFSIRVTGTNFVNNSVVQWAGGSGT